MDQQSAFPNPFWDYSLRVYGRDALRSLLLDLQNKHQADVNILLFILWRAASGAPSLSAREIDSMVQTISPIRTEVIDPLRKVRATLKHPLPNDLAILREDLRQKTLAAELAAEALAQTLLYNKHPIEPSRSGPTDAPTDARETLITYLRTIWIENNLAASYAEELVTLTQ